MGLTRPRASQIQNIDYKQTARAVTTSNIANLSGGAPATVDGVSLAKNNRVLVTGQSTGSQNGIYKVTTVGAGSNGTWARTTDSDATGDLNAGTIIMITEGTTYADVQFKLTTDNPITIGTTALTFVRIGDAAFGTVAVSGQDDIVADTIGDTLTIVAGTNLTATTTAGSDTLTLTPSLTPAFTNVSLTGNITLADSGEIQLGSDTDANIKHTGTNLNINETTGDINIRTYANDKDVVIATDDGSGGLASYIVADGSSGAVKLKHYGTNVFETTSTGALIENTSTGDALLLTTTEDSSTAGPVITLKRNSASPADADYMGQLKFSGENDADQEVVYVKVTGKIQDASDGTEDGLLEFANRKAGSNNITMRLRSDSLQLLNGTNFQIRGQQDLRLYDSDSSNYLGFKAPTSVASDVVYTLPADGSNGQVLSTNGSGVLSFVDNSGGGSGSSFPNCTVTPLPSSEGNFDLAKQFDQSGSVETPFEAGGTDAFGVNLGEIYTMMDPVGSIPTATDLGVLS